MILYYIYLYIYILYISYCPCPLSKCINSRHFSQDCYAINRLKYLRQSQTTIIATGIQWKALNSIVCVYYAYLGVKD